MKEAESRTLSQTSAEKLSPAYLSVILLSMLLLPLTCLFIQVARGGGMTITAAGKWFVFWAIGIRLLLAGFKQVLQPEFTARDIFKIEAGEAAVLVRELGFANICFGILGVLSLWLPGFRIPAAVAGGLYMGIAGVYHLIKKPVSPNEMLATASDLFILLVMGVYVADTIH